MSMPRLQVEHNTGIDLVDTDGTLDFDGGSLIVWRDCTRSHLVVAYGPSSGWVCSWEGAADGKDPVRPGP